MKGVILKDFDAHTVDMILKFGPLKTLVHDTIVTYKGQIPNVALWVNEGEVACLADVLSPKKKKNSSTPNDVNPIDSHFGPLLLFLDHALNQKIIGYSVEIEKGAQVIVLDRPMLKILSKLKPMIL